MTNILPQPERREKVQVRNRILSITRNIIPYVKELKQLPLVDSVNACILMQQLDYWFERKPDGFYKFLEPAEGHSAYKKGDSWTEELGLSPDEFRTAFDKIGVRYTTKTKYFKAEDKFQGKYYCSYTDKIEHKTYYLRNHALVDAALASLQFTETEDADSPNSAMAISRDGERQFVEVEEVYPDYTETTTKITSDITQEREQLAYATSPSFGETEIESEEDMDLSNGRGETGKNLRAGESRQATLLPMDFKPSEDTEYWAATTRLNISFKDALEKFKSYHRARGTMLVDWEAELRRWVVSERPNPDKGEGDLGWEAYLNRQGAVTTVEYFLMENGVANRNEIEEGLPELSRATISGCLRENVESGSLANPRPDIYFSTSDYLEDPEYKELVDEQLEALGIEPALPETSYRKFKGIT